MNQTETYVTPSAAFGVAYALAAVGVALLALLGWVAPESIEFIRHLWLTLAGKA